MFLMHIFGEQYEMGLDYIQLLYQQPFHRLPILCLVSKENSTGKSTFAKLLKMILKEKMVVLLKDDFRGSFNSHFAIATSICLDEAKFDKPFLEKINSLSSSDYIKINEQNKAPYETPFFGKFILLSNEEESFIDANKDAIRYWVRKIPVIKKINVHLLGKLKEEIPAFLAFLQKRKLYAKQKSRYWFDMNSL